MKTQQKWAKNLATVLTNSSLNGSLDILTRKYNMNTFPSGFQTNVVLEAIGVPIKDFAV